MALVCINGEMKTFEERFPDIEDLKIEVETLRMVGGGKKWILGKEDIGIYIPCGNSMCEGHGFNIHNFISTMTFKNETFKEDTLKCDGYEKMGGKDRRNCINYLKVKAEVKYKS